MRKPKLNRSRFLICNFVAAFFVPTAQAGILTIDKAGAWESKQSEWQPLRSAYSPKAPPRHVALPASVDSEVLRCSELSYCQISIDVSKKIFSTFDAGSDGDESSKYWVMALGQAYFVSFKSGGKEAVIVLERSVPAVAFGALGDRVGFDAVRRVLYTYRCAETYRCRVEERNYQPPARWGGWVDAKFSDIEVVNSVVTVAAAMPSVGSEGGVLRALGHGRYQEDWTVFEFDDRLNIQRRIELVKRVTNSFARFEKE